MKIKTATIIFPGSTGADDIKDSCEFFEWENEKIWYKDSLNKYYDMIFLPGGIPFEDKFSDKENLIENTAIIKTVIEKKSLLIGFSEGFKILCDLDLLSGKLMPNISGKRISEVRDFSFLDKDVYLPISSIYGNFIKNADFANDIILKYRDNTNISDNYTAGVFDYGNKVIGLNAHPERMVIPKLKNYDGRKVFEFFKNVI